ncbi:MAG: DUF2357 domain-containing protein [Bacteroidales bacterium]|nr:DUF2357 domain-containing protein [Bacteroidales bacterium]
MEILTIEHEDFTLLIECGKYQSIREKAATIIGGENLTSVYSWSEGVKSVKISETEIVNGEKSDAVFFDNADYPIWVDFKGKVENAEFGSVLRSENENFSFRNKILAGFINYGNEIGRSEIVINYKTSDNEKKFVFSFEVLSQKLDYHQHWKTIIEDIEREYRLLSLDYLKRTYHSFSPDSQGDTPELIWWSIFQGEQKKFLGACRSIIERPRRKFTGNKSYLRADRLTRIPTNIENELAENRHNPAYLYCIDRLTYTNDTQENRFLKFAIKNISKQYSKLQKSIEQSQKISDGFKQQIQDVASDLDRLERHPFFRTVGRFKGLTQESLVLQRAFGYSQVYKTYNLLKRAYSLNDGVYRLQTKDIATLYEIWCFIEVSHIVKERLNITADDIEHRNRTELNGLFTWELGKGESSKILFKKDGVELAELVYNPQHTNHIGVDGLVAPTTIQKPDIVLQLTKNDLKKDFKMTWLFDAKYRIQGRENGVDIPPEDAINQMHRYRDAIYYRDYADRNALKKEVIGGYILFPGNGKKADFEISKFYKNINEVNIGAFPLKPGDSENRQLLENFIGSLIDEKSSNLIQKVIPQKGTVLELYDRVLIGVVAHNEDQFINGSAKLYYTREKFPTTIALDNLHYFMPFYKERGILNVFKITKIRTITSSEAKSDVSAGEGLRISFELEYSHKMFEDFVKIKTSGMILNTFIDTKLDDLGTLLL